MFENHLPWELYKAEQDLLTAKTHTEYLAAQQKCRELMLAATLRRHY